MIQTLRETQTDRAVRLDRKGVRCSVNLCDWRNVVPLAAEHIVPLPRGQHCTGTTKRWGLLWATEGSTDSHMSEIEWVGSGFFFLKSKFSHSFCRPSSPQAQKWDLFVHNVCQNTCYTGRKVFTVLTLKYTFSFPAAADGLTLFRPQYLCRQKATLTVGGMLRSSNWQQASFYMCRRKAGRRQDKVREKKGKKVKCQHSTLCTGWLVGVNATSSLRPSCWMWIYCTVQIWVFCARARVCVCMYVDLARTSSPHDKRAWSWRRNA